MIGSRKYKLEVEQNFKFLNDGSPSHDMLTVLNLMKNELRHTQHDEFLIID